MTYQKKTKLTEDEKIQKAIENLKSCINDLTVAISEKIIYEIVRKNTSSSSKSALPQTTSKRDKVNWSKKSNAALYSALNHRRRNGQEIELELSDALIDRFPTYDPQTHTITRRSNKITDWSTATDAQLKSARHNRHAAKKPLEPELIAALQEHFPNYDATTDTFISQGTDWSKMTKKQLQTAVHYRKRRNLDIPNEIITALEEKSAAPRKTTIREDWSDAPTQNLRAAYHYRITHNMPIEQSLNTALAAAFPGYDPETMKFTGKHRTHKKEPVIPTKQSAQRLFPIYSVPSTCGKYTLYFNDGKTNEKLLIGGAQPYEVCLINTKTKLAVIRKTIDSTKFALHIIDYTTGEFIPESKSGAAIISYDTLTNNMHIKKYRDSAQPIWRISTDKSAIKTISIPTDHTKIMANQIKRETVLIDDIGNVSVHPLLVLDSCDNNEAQNATIEKMLSEAPERLIKSATSTKKTTIISGQKNDKKPQSNFNEIPVYVEHIKSNLMGTYNNVYINGQKVLTNHFGTRIKLLQDGALLGVYGIVTNNSELPQSPIWMIYDTSIRSRITLGTQKFSGYQIHAKNIIDTAEGLRIDLSNRSIALLKHDRILNQAKNKRFVLQTEKTK